MLDGLACAVGAIGAQLGLGIKARSVRPNPNPNPAPTPTPTPNPNPNPNPKPHPNKTRIVTPSPCDDLILAFMFCLVTCCCFVLGFVTSAASGVLGMHSVPLVSRQ